MNKENEQRLKEKIDFFMSENIKVHVELIDRTFLNGFLFNFYVKKKIRENVYWFIDDKLGEVYLFLKDIYDIDKFNKIKEVEDEKEKV